jgi:polar amino acid transport system substrate-binding protein
MITKHFYGDVILRFSVFPTLLLTTCLLLSISSKGKQTITFGTGIFPPGNVIDPETGRCSGRLIDTVNKIFTESDFRLKFICTTPGRIYRMIENGEIDLTVNVTATAQLNGMITYVKPPYRDLNISLFKHQDIKQSKIISAVRGYQYNGQRKRLQEQGFEFYDLPDSASALRFFMKKRSTYILSYRAPIIYMLNQNPTSDEHHLVEEKVSSLPTYFAISNKSKMFDKIKKVLKNYITKHDRKYFLDDDTTKLYLGENGVTIESL